ncbi:hypothetical protein DFH06DRAFT_142945 [Mycena polygramma]|nr:hypothetical protein DFH06DRAFT_142945 [Mycena polygramma]
MSRRWDVGSRHAAAKFEGTGLRNSTSKPGIICLRNHSRYSYPIQRLTNPGAYSHVRDPRPLQGLVPGHHPTICGVISRPPPFGGSTPSASDIYPSSRGPGRNFTSDIGVNAHPPRRFVMALVCRGSLCFDATSTGSEKEPAAPRNGTSWYTRSCVVLASSRSGAGMPRSPISSFCTIQSIAGRARFNSQCPDAPFYCITGI